MKTYTFTCSGINLEIDAASFHTALYRLGKNLERRNKLFFNGNGSKGYCIKLLKIGKREIKDYPPTRYIPPETEIQTKE
ncbi:MAG: hypothetical protein PHN89_05755 [Candidatus Pacebacteria bacterium]|nr:hypothetical protein [Candidatus Paceibacterota bacterium]